MHFSSYTLIIIDRCYLNLVAAGKLLYTGKISPRFIFALFALSLEGEFKTGLIELYINNYTRNLESGRIQD